MTDQPSRSRKEWDLKSPKKQRYAAAEEPPPAGRPSNPGPDAASPIGQQLHQQRQTRQHWAQQAPRASPFDGQPQEAGGSNEEALAGGGEATVTDAAKAFRELRVRPALSGVAARASSPHRGGIGGGPDRPSSPKKRKAAYNIDKEFILKDDKVKRNTDTQGDISQARGQLGQLLFEFSQIELNRDLLEAIRRTESKTGRTSGRSAAPGRLDRAAFESAVTDAAELLQAQLSTVESHTEDAALRSAILRTYAVQAIATFADQDSSSDEDGDDCGADSSSSDDENNDSNSQRRQYQRLGSSSHEGGGSLGGGGGGGSAGQQSLSADTGSQSAGMLPRPSSAAAFYSPPQQQPQQALPQPGRQLAGGGGGGGGHGGGSGGGGSGRGGGGRGATSSGMMRLSPGPHQPAGSAAEQTSSSFLPDAPPDSALEDTATAAPRAEPAGSMMQLQEAGGQAAFGHGQGHGQRLQMPASMAAAVAAAGFQQQHGQRRGQHGQRGHPGRGGEEESEEGGDAAAGHLRMLSLEAEGSALEDGSHAMQQHSAAGGGGGIGDDGEGGLADMVQSPAPVTSRRMPPPLPLPLLQEGEEGEEEGEEEAGTSHRAAMQMVTGQQAQQEQEQEQVGMAGVHTDAHAQPQQQQQLAAGVGRLGGASRRAPAGDRGSRLAAPEDEACKLTLSARNQQQQQRWAQRQEREQQQQQGEVSDGSSQGQASSLQAAPEPPKRQRRSGDLLPPLQEHGSHYQLRRQRQHPPPPMPLHQQQEVGMPPAALQQQAAVAAGTSAADAAAAAAAAAAAQRAQILGRLQLSPAAAAAGAGAAGSPQDPQQPQQQQQSPSGVDAAAPSVAGPPQQQLQQQTGSPVLPQQQQVQVQGDAQPANPLQQQQGLGQAVVGAGAAAAAAAAAAAGPASHATQHQGRAYSGGGSSSVGWGSTLVCADLTLNDVASQYWPFLRSAMQGQAAQLQQDDRALVVQLVRMLGDTITDTYMAEAGCGRRPTAEVRSLVAATAFDDFFRAKQGAAGGAGESAAASLL